LSLLDKTGYNNKKIKQDNNSIEGEIIRKIDNTISLRFSETRVLIRGK